MTHEEFVIDVARIINGEKHLSFSALKAFLKSPKHYYAYKTQKKTTAAMEEGKQFHMACLQMDIFKQTYWVLDDAAKCEELIKGGAKSPRATVDYKKWVLEQQDLNAGKEMISMEDYATYVAMSKFLNQCSATKDLMAELTEKESPFEFQYDFVIKGQIDGRGADYIIDLKKVADARIKKVKWLISDDDYDMQAAIYCKAKGLSKYFLIFIDSDCNVSVVKLSDDSLQRGLNKLDVAVSEFQRCAEEDAWNSSYEFFQGNYIEI